MTGPSSKRRSDRQQQQESPVDGSKFRPHSKTPRGAAMEFPRAVESILAEIHEVLGQVDGSRVAAFRQAVKAARAVFVTGEGRSGLVGRCLAMRLAHLGLRAHVVGETTTPPLGEGDVLVAVSGTGTSEVTLARARLAAQNGAGVLAVTAAGDAPLARLADVTLLIPARRGSGDAPATAQYGGSLFEQCTLIAFDAIVLQLQADLSRTAAQMNEHHATVE
jgi:6-phospho-3-hexuloisomerase